MEVPYSRSCYLCYLLIIESPRMELSTFNGETDSSPFHCNKHHPSPLSLSPFGMEGQKTPFPCQVLLSFPAVDKCFIYQRAQWEELINHLYAPSRIFFPKLWLLHLLEMFSPDLLLHFLQVLIPKLPWENYRWPPHLNRQLPIWQSVSLSLLASGLFGFLFAWVFISTYCATVPYYLCVFCLYQWNVSSTRLLPVPLSQYLA